VELRALIVEILIILSNSVTEMWEYINVLRNVITSILIWDVVILHKDLSVRSVKNLPEVLIT